MIKKLGKNVVYLVVVFFAIAGLVALYSADIEKIENVSLSQLASQINKEEVKLIKVEKSNLEIELKDGKKLKSRKEIESSLSETLTNLGADQEKLKAVQIEIKDTTGKDTWIGILLTVGPFLLIGTFIIWFFMKQAQRGNNQAMMFGASRARMLVPTKDGKNRITFKDVAGAEEAKEELHEVVDFLKNPKKFLSIGARIPRGVLLLGPPGTGKTLMAKAVAGEANVPFFTISGSEFVEMFVGVGASRVRDLFKQAKKNAPAIVFIDEIDAVGRQRGAGLGGGHDEREQTLNQILVEMDGFDTNVNVIVIASTNRPDVLDPALLRPGRFDRRVMIDNPDIKEREAILKIHVKGKPLAKEVNLRQLAERTPGFSGADLANLVNEAAILAARRNKKIVGMDEMREAIEKVILGPERRSHVLSKEEKKITAYHESGHALASALLPKADPVQKVSIISRGRAAGYTLNVPEKDKSLHFRSYYLDQICVLLAGYATEEMIFGEMTTGASNDLERATEMTRKLVTKFGMSGLGPVTFGNGEGAVFLGKEIHERKNYSEKTAEEIDKEVQKFIEKAYKKTKALIVENKETLDKLVKRLLKKEIIEKEEFDKIIAGEEIEEEGDKLDGEKNKRKIVDKSDSREKESK